MERIAPSIEQAKVFKSTGIETVEDLIYADLRAAGWDKPDAFYAAYRDAFSTYPKREVDKIIKRIETSPGVQKRMNRDAETVTHMDTADIARETSKEKILSDLVIARRKMKEGTKEWAELTKMIGDYAKIKQDDIKVEEEQVRYYLPVAYPTSCKDCLLGPSMRGK